MPESSDAEPTDSNEEDSGLLPRVQASVPDGDSGSTGELPIPPEILEKLQPEDREAVLRVFSAGMQWSGPMPNPLLAKFEPQHISDLIGLASKTLDVTQNDRKHSRLIGTITLALVLASALSLLLVLAIRDQNDLLVEVVKLAAIGIGSFGGGYGFAALRSRE